MDKIFLIVRLVNILLSYYFTSQEVQQIVRELTAAPKKPAAKVKKLTDNDREITDNDRENTEN